MRSGVEEEEEEAVGRCCGAIHRGPRRGSRGATLRDSCLLAVVLGLAFCGGVADAKTWIPLGSHDPGSSAPAPASSSAAAEAGAAARAGLPCCCFGKARMMSAAGLMSLRGGARKESFPAPAPESVESDSGEMFSDGSLPTSTTKGGEVGARKDDDRGDEAQEDKEKEEEEETDDDNDPFPVPRVIRLQKEGKVDGGMSARMHKAPGADRSGEMSSASSRGIDERGDDDGDDDGGGAYGGWSDMGSSLDVEVIHGDERPRMVDGGADETETKEGGGRRKKIKTALAYEVGKLPPGWKYRLPKEKDLGGGCNMDDIEASFALIPDDYGRIDYSLARKGSVGEGRKRRGAAAQAQGDGEATSRSVYVGGLHFKVTLKHQVPMYRNHHKLCSVPAPPVNHVGIGV
jgi:hypothetical protein